MKLCASRINISIFERVFTLNLLKWGILNGSIDGRKYSQYNAEPNVSMTLNQIESILNQLSLKYSAYYLNKGFNIWIMKPSASSRGRGIQLSSNFTEILSH